MFNFKFFKNMIKRILNLRNVAIIACLAGSATMFAQETGVKIGNTTWATRNVDMPNTFAENSWDAGMFYQWNRNVGWSATAPMVNSNGGTNWNSDTPEETEWEKANDPCPTGWRVPTQEELQELTNADYVWTTRNSVSGCLFDNSLFLPAVGYRLHTDGTLQFAGSQLRGFYWSSTYSSGTHAYDLYLLLITNSIGISTNYRDFGMSIRCVSE